ncbi:MAG: hypothetical protein JNK82_33890 [Myxococcaceae bacterium]|nr:hypothetical protein [Myxococcaceae bacterium]
MSAKIIAFVGPSLPGVRLRGVEVRGPARQGDVWRALEARPRAIALVDGVFEHVPSVWHHELRAALASGVAVFGGASMGALRAAELHTHGMIGVGQIFRWYRDGVLKDDGAVALLHGEEDVGWRPLTVPLVNVMHVAERLKLGSRLTKVAAKIFYQQRTWPAVWRAFGEDHEARRRELGEDLKALDARATLDAAVELVKSGAPKGPVSVPQVSSFVRRRRIADVHGVLPDSPEGTRRVLLAAWAQSLGLEPDPHAVRAWEAKLTLKDPAERLRAATLLALEERVLEAPERLLPDGPSKLEGAWLAQAVKMSKRP